MGRLMLCITPAPWNIFKSFSRQAGRLKYIENTLIHFTGTLLLPLNNVSLVNASVGNQNNLVPYIWWGGCKMFWLCVKCDLHALLLSMRNKTVCGNFIMQDGRLVLQMWRDHWVPKGLAWAFQEDIMAAPAKEWEVCLSHHPMVTEAGYL